VTFSDLSGLRQKPAERVFVQVTSKMSSTELVENVGKPCNINEFLPRIRAGP